MSHGRGLLRLVLALSILGLGDAARASDSTSVDDYGAVCLHPSLEGSVSDATKEQMASINVAAIRRGLDNARGRTLRFGSCIYYVSGALGPDLFSLQTTRVVGEHWWRNNQGGTILRVVGAQPVDKVFYCNFNRCQVESLAVLCSGKANHGIHLQNSHSTLIENVGIEGCLQAGVRAKASTFTMRQVSSGVNQGRGFWLSDTNASTFYDLVATWNTKEGFYLAAENGAQASGFTLHGADFEINGIADIWLKGVNTPSQITGLHVESKAEVDSLVLEDVRHLTSIGNRLTGGGVTSRALRLIGVVEGNTFLGMRSAYGVEYERITLHSGAWANTFIGCKHLAQAGTPEPLHFDGPNLAQNTVIQ